MTTDVITETRRISVSHPSTSDKNILTAARDGSITLVGTFGIRRALCFGYFYRPALSAEQYSLYSLALTTQSVVVGIALPGLGASVVRYLSLH